VAVPSKTWVTGLVFSPDGKTLLAVGHNLVGVWEVESGRRLAEWAHPSVLTSAAFAPDSRTFLTSSTDGKVRLWGLSQAATPDADSC